MKTIRLEVNDLVDDIAKGPFSIIGPDYKVIVLFRDPRAIMTSIKLTPDFWTHEIQNEHYICSQINQNINALNKLPHPVSSRIRFIKYEDFVAKSDQIIEELYEFLGISFLVPFAKQAVRNHIQPEPQEIKWDKVLEGEIVGKPRYQNVTVY